MYTNILMPRSDGVTVKKSMTIIQHTLGQSTGVGLNVSTDADADVLQTWHTVSHPASGQNVRFGSISTSDNRCKQCQMIPALIHVHICSYFHQKYFYH